MKRGKRRSILAILAVVLLITSCTRGVINSNPSGSNNNTAPVSSPTSKLPVTMDTAVPNEEGPHTSNPASIKINLQKNSTATATIGPKGGSIGITSEDGTEYTLIIPEGALFTPEEITMTPIASAEGAAIGDTFLAGVSLQPEGLHFLEFVTIEIAGSKIGENSVAFAAENGGKDFHLTPSQTADGVINIITTHFSDFGVSFEDLGKLVESIVPLAEKARLEHDLVIGDDARAMAAFERIVESLMDTGEIGNFERWVPWTAQVTSLFLRLEDIGNRKGWNENTPGFTDLTKQMQELLDKWFQQSEGLLPALVEKCALGEIDNAENIALILAVGNWFNNRYVLERGKALSNWQGIAIQCLNLDLTWQADIVTSGIDFSSDISVGAELQAESSDTFYPWVSKSWDDNSNGKNEAVFRIENEQELEVEFIDGFWHNLCIPKSGSVTLTYEIVWGSLNLSILDDVTLGHINNISAFIMITEPVYIDCSPAGFEFDADAQAPFHGKALEELNKDRLDKNDYWKFELKYNPGGGVVAQFVEGYKPDDPVKIGFGEKNEDGNFKNEYRLQQLISLYHHSSAKE